MFADATYYAHLLKNIADGVAVPPDKMKEVANWCLGKLQELRVINQQLAEIKPESGDNNALLSEKS